MARVGRSTGGREVRAAGPSWRHGVLEDVARGRLRLGRLGPTEVVATRAAWLGPLLWLVLGLALRAPAAFPSAAARGLDALGFALAVVATNVVHALGHVASAWAVGGPMDEVLVTMTRYVNVYRGPQEGLPPRVHLGRAVGGLSANALAAVALAALAETIAPGWARATLQRAAGLNALFALGSLLPLPTVDGAVIARELRRVVRGAGGGGAA